MVGKDKHECNSESIENLSKPGSRSIQFSRKEQVLESFIALHSVVGLWENF